MGSCLITLYAPTQSQVELAEQVARRLGSIDEPDNAPLDPKAIAQLSNPQNAWFKDYQKVNQPSWLPDYFQLLSEHLSYPYWTDSNTAFLAVSDKLKRMFEARDRQTSITWDNAQGEHVTRVPSNEDLQDKMTAVFDEFMTSDADREIHVDLEKITLINALDMIETDLESNTLIDPREEDGPWNVAEKCIVKHLATYYELLTDTEAFGQFMIKHQDELDQEDAFICSDDSYTNLNESTGIQYLGRLSEVYELDSDDNYDAMSALFDEALEYNEGIDEIDSGDQDLDGVGLLLSLAIDDDDLDPDSSVIDDDLSIGRMIPLHDRYQPMPVYQPQALDWPMMWPILMHVGVAGCVLGVVMFILTCCIVPCVIWVGFRCFMRCLGKKRTDWMKEAIMSDIENVRRRTRDTLLRSDDIETASNGECN
eukprot:267799_1